jgi:hypothetical protein
MASDAANLVTYHGNCHCSAFKFSIKVPEIKNTIHCTCTYCSQLDIQYLGAPIKPDEIHLDIERGEDVLTVYKYGTRTTSQKVTTGGLSRDARC